MPDIARPAPFTLCDSAQPINPARGPCERFCAQVIIIGAGPAGALAAVALLSRGHSVLLIEQHRFPRDKVCGECLSATGINVIHRLGLRDPLDQLGPIPLHEVDLFDSRGKSAHLKMPRNMLGLSRLKMDEMLLNQARRWGARILQPARCEQIQPGDRPVVGIRDLETNTIDHFRTRFVLLADGKAGLPGPRPKPTGDLGIKCHLRGVKASPNAISLFGTSHGYGGVAPIENGLWNAAFSVPIAAINALASRRGDMNRLDAVLQNLGRENNSLRVALQGAERVSSWQTCALPRFSPRSFWPKNIIPIGNAAASMEPVGGEGMGLALASAELAAIAIDRALNSGRFDAGNLAAAYRRLWRIRQPICRALGAAMSHRSTGTAVVTGARLFPTLARGSMQLIGK